MKFKQALHFHHEHITPSNLERGHQDREERNNLVDDFALVC
jgi:hypothetical protein